MRGHVLYVEMHRAVNLKKPGVNKKASALNGAKENGEDYCDPSGERQTEKKAPVASCRWEAHT